MVLCPRAFLLSILRTSVFVLSPKYMMSEWYAIASQMSMAMNNMIITKKKGGKKASIISLQRNLAMNLKKEPNQNPPYVKKLFWKSSKNFPTNKIAQYIVYVN